ncbi:NlpC/P60 family protein [Yoonia sp. SS1-5]|uniref:NlpC/P60 family protein n=1 Tax=Yoonia rhodophyticola TaxID=3137370 RepID=A0AAN0NHG8_9RHOB
MTRALVNAARGWIGTPYMHQAAVKGAGCDCLGLLRGVWADVFGAEPEKVPSYTADWSEPQGRELLFEAACRHMTPLTDTPLQSGQVLLFRMRQGAVAKHLGILAEAGVVPTFIHAYAGHGVIESPLSAPWRRRIAARFAVSEGTY